MNYKKIMNIMAQITSAIWDMEGGYWLWAIIYELLESLQSDENYTGCCLIIQKLSEITMSEFIHDLTPIEICIFVNEILPDFKGQILE